MFTAAPRGILVPRSPHPLLTPLLRGPLYASPVSLSSPDSLPLRPPGQRLGGPPSPRHPPHLTCHPQRRRAPSPGRWPQQQLSRGAGTPASPAGAWDDGHAYPPGPSSVLRPPSLNTSPEPHVCRHVPPAPRPLPVTISKKRHHSLESLAPGFHHGRVLLSTVRPRTDSVCSMAPRGCHRAERPPPPGDLMAVILSQHNASRGDAGVAGPLPCPP